MDSVAFAAAVLSRLDAPTRAAVEHAGLAAQLATGLHAVHARWPDAPAPGDGFAAYLADRIAAQKDLVSALPRLRVDDLYLAWWSGSGDPEGIRTFEQVFADDISKVLSRFHRLQSDELRQSLRVKLFVQTREKPPRISLYTGFGFLQNWLRVVATRDFVDAVRREHASKIEAELDEKEMLGIVAPSDPRLDQIRGQLGSAVKRAFAAAVASLAPRERTFLRHQHVDKLTLDQISSTYNVHRTTVARTLASARDHLIEQTRSQVATELGIRPDDLASVIAALDTNLALSLSRVLGSDP